MFHYDYKTENTCSFAMMHKGRPNADDCKAAAEFAGKIISL